MAMVQPIGEGDLERVAQFLHQQLNPAISVAGWRAALRPAWAGEWPNCGFLLTEAGEIVGVFPVMYSHRLVRGRREAFAHLHSWVVLPDYRGSGKGGSLDLIRAILAQTGYTFFATTPNPTVVRIYQRFKFKVSGGTVTVLPCLPLPGPLGVRVVTDGEEMLSVLDPETARHYRDHREYPWLGHLVVGEPGSWCYLIHKPDRLKRLPSRRILHMSDPNLFVRYRWAVGRHLLWRHGALTLQVSTHLLDRQPWPALVLPHRQPTAFLGSSLAEHEVNLLYSEMVVLDL